MALRSITDDYADAAMCRAVLRALADGSWVGRIHGLKGVVAFGETPKEAADELHSALVDWIHAAAQSDVEFPVYGGIDLNDPANRRLIPC